MRRITRSYRIRAYPNGAQRRLLERWFGASRWLWNTALEIRSEAYRVCGLNLTGDDLSRWLTQWKRTPGHRDLRVDAGDACPEEDLLAQVLAEEARSGHRNRACLEQAWFS
jgi:transposase